MFSFGDVLTLNESYTQASGSRKPEVVNILVCKNQQTGAVSVYAIKVDNPAALQFAIDTKIGNTPGVDDEAKINKIMFDQGRKYDVCNGDFELEFLKQFASYGISLYRANDDTVQSWSKLSRNPSNLQQVQPTPCN
jgi:hypothetical protein